MIEQGGQNEAVAVEVADHFRGDRDGAESGANIGGDMETVDLLIGFIGMGIGALITWLAMQARQERQAAARRMDGLEKNVAELGEQVKHLRFTHRTVAGLEDALAVLIDTELEAEAFQARLKTIHRILGKTREGPESYSNSEFEPPHCT